MGFRPAVARAAARAALGGFVRNDSSGLVIEVEGDEPAMLARFVDALMREAPPLARVDAIESADIAPRGEREFHVVASAASASAAALIPPDAATCAACLRELFDPANRRYRYPFINCTDCGPRYTIVRELPYNRPKTTMAGFGMCAACLAEYEIPGTGGFTRSRTPARRVGRSSCS